MGQYIGARYVPRFMGTYDATQSYEALDVVDNGSGTSYISKIPTPAGTPLTDTTHWAVYGATSGAIINLQNQIDDMNDGSVPGSLQNQISENTSDITDIQSDLTSLSSAEAGNHVFLAIGDSYGMRPDSQPTWTEKLVGRYPTARQKSYSGIGFGTDYINNKNFYWVAEQFVAELTDDEKEEITDIIVCGGWNDARELLAGNITASDLQQLIFTFVTYCNTHFPNAKVWIGFVGWQTADRTQTGVDFDSLQTIQEIYEYTVYKNLYHLPNVSSVMKCSKLMDDSYFHPNPTGSTFLFETILAGVNGGANFDWSYTLSNSDFTFTKGSGSLAKGSVAIHNDIARIYLQFGSVTGDTNDPITIEYGKKVWPDGHMNASSTRFIAMSSNDNKALYGIITPSSIIIYGTENLVSDTVLIDIVVNTRYEC